jgi:predicted ArsR family transcriptional regulator
MMESRKAQISAVAALDEPIRPRLHDYVVRQPRPVSRDDAAAGLQLPRTTAAFRLDRLMDEGLRVLQAHGFEPRIEGGEITLVNCPFHTLAQDYTELVCGMNLRLLNGLSTASPTPD